MATPRGKNYACEELKQVCRSVLHIWQDQKTGNGQRSENFWARVHQHYHRYKPAGFEKRGVKSLEGKWGNIKHDITKFIGAYKQVEDLQILGSNSEDTILKAKELYKQKHPKGKGFTYENCFWILKDYPRWMSPADEMGSKKKSKSPASHTTADDQVGEGACSESVQQLDSDEGNERTEAILRKRPGGNKKAKEDGKRMKLEQEALKASLKHQANIDITNADRIQCLQVNTMMRLIMMPTQNLNPALQAFAESFQLEQAEKLRKKMAANDIDEELVQRPSLDPELEQFDADQGQDMTRSPPSPDNGEYYVPEPPDNAQIVYEHEYNSRNVDEYGGGQAL